MHDNSTEDPLFLKKLFVPLTVVKAITFIIIIVSNTQEQLFMLFGLLRSNNQAGALVAAEQYYLLSPNTQSEVIYSRLLQGLPVTIDFN